MAIIFTFINTSTTIDDVLIHICNHYGTLPSPYDLKLTLQNAYDIFCNVTGNKPIYTTDQLHNLFIALRRHKRRQLNYNINCKDLHINYSKANTTTISNISNTTVLTNISSIKVIPISAGQLLQEYLGIHYTQDNTINNKYLIKGIDPIRQYDIMFNDKSITIEEAILIAKYFHTSVQFWLDSELEYQANKLFYI